MNAIPTDMPPEVCVEQLGKYLECPVDFWKKIFHDLSQEARILYVMLLVFPMPIEMEILKRCYNATLKVLGVTLDWSCFSDVIIELEKTVIRTDIYNADYAEMIAITFQNPSAKDFLIALIREAFEKYHELLVKSCQYFSQYVEYLKVLDEIDAPVEIYAEVFEQAMVEIRSDSILFYDKYKQVLLHNRELEKYYERYETKLDCRDVGLGRLFQLLLLYKDGCKESAKVRLKTLVLSIMKDIECYPELVLHEDLKELPDVIIAVYRTGICKDMLWMTEIFMNSLMQNRMDINDVRIKSAYPEIWRKYVKTHGEKIASYLDKYYEAELCLAAASEDSDEFNYQCFRCEESYEEYNMEIPTELRGKIDLYDSWVAAEESLDEFDELKYSTNRQNINEIEVDFRGKFLEVILPKEIDMEQWMETHIVPIEVKKVLRQMEDVYHIIWSDFLYDEDSLEFLEAFIMFTGKLPEKVDEIFKELANYMEAVSGLKLEDLSEFVTRLDEAENDKRIWSRAELETICSDLFFEQEDFLEKMVESRVLVNKYHWYRLVNEWLIFCVQMAEIVSDNDKMKDYYLAIREQILEQDIKNEEWVFWKCLYLLEPNCYKSYILIPAVHHLYKEVEKGGNLWIKNLLDFLDVEIEFENDEVVGGTCTGDTFWEILEIYLENNLFDILDIGEINEQILLLKENGFIGKEYQIITLKALEEADLLKSLGVYEKLERLWETICEWQKEM